MPKHFAVIALLFCLASVTYGQKYRIGQRPTNQNPADYTIQVHVSAIHFRPCATEGVNTACGGGVFADATLDGKKVELFGGVDKGDINLIVPGDYLARLFSKKPRNGGKAVLFQAYNVLLPDKTAWPCDITGFSE
jgi:hypothetical protein